MSESETIVLLTHGMASVLSLVSADDAQSFAAYGGEDWTTTAKADRGNWSITVTLVKEQ